jgi:hypothetical protein
MPMHRTVTASRTAAAVLFTAVVSVVGVFGVSAWAVTLVPLKGQSPEQMAVDQQECASQATAQTGYNPSAPPPTTSAAQPERGQRLAGAARGAAAGKVVSNITKESETSEATEAGAKLGAMRGVLSSARADGSSAGRPNSRRRRSNRDRPTTTHCRRACNPAATPSSNADCCHRERAGVGHVVRTLDVGDAERVGVAVEGEAGIRRDLMAGRTLRCTIKAHGVGSKTVQQIKAASQR